MTALGDSRVRLASRGTSQPSIARLPLVLRTASDVKTLRANSRAARRLPAGGVKIAIDGLSEAAARALHSRINDYIRACGCAEGGAFALVVFLGVAALVAAHVLARGPRLSDLGTAALGLLAAVLFGALGKAVGLLLARLRFERCCDQVIRLIAKN